MAISKARLLITILAILAAWNFFDDDDDPVTSVDPEISQSAPAGAYGTDR